MCMVLTFRGTLYDQWSSKVHLNVTCGLRKDSSALGLGMQTRWWVRVQEPVTPKANCQVLPRSVLRCVAALPLTAHRQVSPTLAACAIRLSSSDLLNSPPARCFVHAEGLFPAPAVQHAFPGRGLRYSPTSLDYLYICLWQLPRWRVPRSNSSSRGSRPRRLASDEVLTLDLPIPMGWRPQNISDLVGSCQATAISFLMRESPIPRAHQSRHGDLDPYGPCRSRPTSTAYHPLRGYQILHNQTL